MNYSTAIFLVNKSVRAIVGIYEDDDGGKKSVAKALFKTLDPTISVGDYVLVPTGTRHKMSVNKVVEVDVDIDFENTTPISWVIAVVDRSDFERTTKMEEQAIATIKSAEKRRRQDELRAALLKDNPDLQTLAIVDATASPVAPAETPPSRSPGFDPTMPQF